MTAGEVLTISLPFLFVNDWSSPLKMLLRRKQSDSTENSELHWFVYTAQYINLFGEERKNEAGFAGLYTKIIWCVK